MRAGAGGWSRRRTLYGGDHSTALRDPARIRAMYTPPDFVRGGIGRLILARCEQAAAPAGFGRFELMATLSGQPLCAACGYAALETVAAVAQGCAVALVRRRKEARA